MFKYIYFYLAGKYDIWDSVLNYRDWTSLKILELSILILICLGICEINDTNINTLANK